jgi:hypothetical protein
MSPTTLYREGTDLDDLLAELDSRYPGQGRVVEVTHPREGGVLGFFAKQRVGVHYRLIDEGDAAEPDSAHDAVLDARSRRPVPERVDAAALGGGPARLPEYDAAPVAGSAGPVRSKLLRDGFGPDPAAIRAALAQRAAADAPAAAPPAASPAPAAPETVGSEALSRGFSTAAARTAGAVPPAAPVPLAAPAARSASAAGLQFEQLLADIALKKATSGAAPGAAPAASMAAPRRISAQPDPAEWVGTDNVAARRTPDRPDHAEWVGSESVAATRAPGIPVAAAVADSTARSARSAAPSGAVSTPSAAAPTSAAASFAAIDFAELASFTATAFGSTSTGASGAPAAATEAASIRAAIPPAPTPPTAPATPTITLRRRSERAVPHPEVQAPPTPRPGALSWPLVGGRAASATALLERPTSAPAARIAAEGAATETAAAAPAGEDSAASTDSEKPIADADNEKPREDAENQNSIAEPASMRAASYPIDDGSTTTSRTTPLTLRRTLLEVGVPVDRVPTTAVHSYAAVEQLARALAPAPALPIRPGQILVLAGPARDVMAAVDSVLAGNPGVFESIWTFGCPAGLGTRRVAGSARAFASAEQAADVARDARADADGPTLVAVATDAALADDASDVLAALGADAVWAAVDATRKPADTRRALRALPAPDAIVVANAELSASPATVWELDLPIALVDGRPSSGPSWAVLLLGKLAELEETECSDAPC